MKKISTLLIGTLFSLSLLAYDGTRLSVTSVSNTKLSMEIDGRRYNIGVNDDVMIRDLEPGRHTIRITKVSQRFDDRNNRGWNIFGGNRNRQDVIYNSTLYVKEGYFYDITITRFGKVVLDERRMDRNDEWYSDNDDDRDRDYRDDRDRDNDRDWNDRDGRDRNGNGNGYGYMRPMDQRDFQRAKETIDRESFDNSKLVMARQIIDRNYFSAEQAKQLAQLFSFDSYKLDLAKHIYKNTTDKGNFFILYDVFSFSSYKEDLAKYIREYR